MKPLFLTSITAALLFLLACDLAKNEDDLTPATGMTTALSMLSSSVHLLNPSNAGISRDWRESSTFWDKLTRPLSVNTAVASITSCSQAAAADICVGETKTASYTDCPIGGLGLLFSGGVVLTYTPTASNCALTAVGSTVTRSMSLDRTTLTGGNILTATGTRTDYLGNAYGGGARLTRLDATHYTLDILGMHKTRTSSAGNEIYNVSVRTTEAFDFLGTPTGNFMLDNGVLEVAHNKAKYLASMVADDVTFDYSTCCYPIGGTLNVTFTGKQEGTGAISFTEVCGEITFVRDGVTSQLDLVGCE